MTALLHSLEGPLIVFLVIVAPIWIVLHYRHKSRRVPVEESAADKEKIEELLALAERMEGRIETLEAILDRQDPNWRHEV